ncbi:MAG TPA: DUF222 domain-containing protein, partial [Streptosporangiaceae bacterium]
LALTLSQASASWWSELAVTLAWRLAATGAALRAGEIDLSRARLIAEATSMLDEETARKVEARVLPRAGEQTTGQLRAALRRAVIAADPKGAERRREEAERRARVMLYPDAEGTASLAGYNLPGVQAAAAMARMSALARAMKASGAAGGMDLLRAQVFLGLLLGTLPYIPPSPSGPPDLPPDDSAPDDPADQPSDETPRGPAEDRGNSPRPEPPPTEPPARGPRGGFDGRAPHDQGSAGAGPDDPGPAGPEPDDPGPPGLDDPGPPRLDDPGPGDPGPAGSDDGYPDAPGCPGDWPADDEDLGATSRPPPAWPEVMSFVPPGPAAMGGLCPVGGGKLDLRVPWSTLAEESREPGYLGRLGPITPGQARYLAGLAAAEAGTQWRVIVTSSQGRAEAVTRVLRHGNDAVAGLVDRVTVTISRDALQLSAAQLSAAQLSGAQLSAATGHQAGKSTAAAERVLAAVVRAAVRAADEADLRTAADVAASGGCAHREASAAYRPPTRLWEYVTARDLTCRFPTCRQPAWRCDLDHTTPYDKGGRTCRCNLGGLCRFHHQLKQHRLWQLTQPVPGTFTWTTPTGRTYAIEPDMHPV